MLDLKVALGVRPRLSVVAEGVAQIDDLRAGLTQNWARSTRKPSASTLSPRAPRRRRRLLPMLRRS